jgi:glycerol-3-phosphate dehydrogenase
VIFLDNLDSLREFDLIIIAIPAQFIWNFIIENKKNFNPWVIFLNLSKWIDNKTLKTTGDILSEQLNGFEYIYAVLSGWMIASELVEWKMLWAQIWCKNREILLKLKNLFESNKLKINTLNDVRNIELIWSLKNVFALYIWYLESKWFWMSSIWYYFCELYKELPMLLKEFGWEENINFSDFFLGGDLIATCFGDSRNRYFWKIVWEGKSPKEAEEILKQEKKHAEWYYTILWIKDKILKNKNLVEFWKIVKIFAK